MRAAHYFPNKSGCFQPIPMCIWNGSLRRPCANFLQRSKFLGRKLYALRKSAGFRFHLCHAVEYAATALSQSICDAPCTVIKRSGFKVMSIARTTSKRVGMTRNQQVSYLHESVEHPACLKCGQPMRLVLVEEEYPGYSRRTFGCQPCDGTVTEWAATPVQGPHSH